MKAMVLAAGFGTRLAPLTDEIPKPCIPVVNVPSILFTLNFLKSQGIDEVMINLHHLGQAIEQSLGTGGGNLPKLVYAHETEILGTGGGIKNVEAFFEGESAFVVANADALMEFDLRQAVERHEESEAAATMLLSSSMDLKKYSSIEIDLRGTVRNIAGRLHDPGDPRKAGGFIGVHILGQKVFEYIPPHVESCINSYTYPRMIENGEEIRGDFVEGSWHDTGTLETYYRTNMDLLDDGIRFSYLDPFESYPLKPKNASGGGVVMGENVELGDGIDIRPPVLIGHNTKIGPGSRIGPYVILGNGCQIGKRVEMVESIAFSGAKIRNRKRLSGMVIGVKHAARIPPSAATTESVSEELEMTEKEAEESGEREV